MANRAMTFYSITILCNSIKCEQCPSPSSSSFHLLLSLLALSSRLPSSLLPHGYSISLLSLLSVSTVPSSTFLLIPYHFPLMPLYYQDRTEGSSAGIFWLGKIIDHSSDLDFLQIPIDHRRYSIPSFAAVLAIWRLRAWKKGALRRWIPLSNSISLWYQRVDSLIYLRLSLLFQAVQ